MSYRLCGNYMKKFLVILSIFIAGRITAQSEIFGLASPIQLNIDTTIVYLEDYFKDVSKIDWVLVLPETANTTLSFDKKILKIASHAWYHPENEEGELEFKPSPPLSELRIYAEGTVYTIILRKSVKEKITFSFNPNDSIYSKVSMVGDLTNWNPNSIYLENKNGIWQTELTLNPGRYQYQIVADGKWFLDPGNSEKIDNGIGGYNSLLKIGNSINEKMPSFIPEKVYADTIWLRNNSPSSNYNTTMIALWENFTIGNKEYDDNNYYVIIPQSARNQKRSNIRIYAYNQAGKSNDLLIPLEYGKVITDPAQLENDDYQKTILYFMMVDRFNDGDKTNDNPVKDDRILPQANYKGGDLAGIQQKIDEGYFQDMGFNALWISPIFQNPYNAYQEYPEPHRWFSGYHGYWPISLSQVDTRFGNNALFKDLVDDAHKNNMSVYLDYVANHIHEQHPLWKQHPEWFSQLNLPDGRKNLRLWDENRLTTWFEPYMPSFDHSQPVVAEACADSAMYWLKEFDLDGFRHDATKHIETEFWRLLTHKIKTEVEIPQQRNIYQIGETFGSRELINSYIGSGLLNAQFDFDLYFDARSVFALDDVSFERLSASLHETFDTFGWHHVMGNITGNQDMARFISYASGDLKFDENDKEVGWHRDIEVTDTIGYSKLKMLHAFNMTVPGIPIVYYGDEIGMPGANDPDNRRMMIFDSLNTYQQDVKNTVTKLAKLRSEHMALLYGDFEEIGVSDEMFSYARNYFNDAVYVYFNKSNKATSIIQALPASLQDKKVISNFGSVLSVYSNKFSVDLKPYSFEIITFE